MSAKVLSQVETIRSLGEALGWLQRELSWGVTPAALPHLTGRIGELFAAVTINGEMASAVNQRGYDVMVKETNQRVSVKTVTTSSHVTFRASTFDQVDRVMVFKIDVDGDEISIKTILDKTAEEARQLCTIDGGGNYSFVVRNRVAQVRPLEQQDLREQARWGAYLVKQYANGTINVDRDGLPVPLAMPALRAIAAEIGVSLLNSMDNPRNTRALGAEVIAVFKAKEDPVGV